MSTREIAIVLTDELNRIPDVSIAMCCEKDVVDTIDAALTKAIADERAAVWREVLAIADSHLDEPGFGYLLRDKLKNAAASRRVDTADTQAEQEQR
jgi:hypothetical protein